MESRPAAGELIDWGQPLNSPIGLVDGEVMRRADTNLFRLDDLLIRIGSIGLLASVAIGAITLMVFAADAGVFDRGLVFRLLGRYRFFAFAFLVIPGTLLFVGRSIRTRERRIVAIWKLLRQRVRISVPELVANSHFTSEDIEDAVKLLNTRGLGHYVWDRTSGTVQDGRLETETLLIDECEFCGGTVSVQVPIGFDRIPTCEYCGDPVGADELESRRKAAIEALRAEHAPKRADLGSSVPFSIPLFIVLMLVFWPAGVAYALYMCQNQD